MVMAFSPDVGLPVLAEAPTMATVSEVNGASLSSVWSPNEVEVHKALTGDFLFTEAPVGTTVGDQVDNDRLAAAGCLLVATEAAPDSTALGRIWIEYDIVFALPSNNYGLVTLMNLDKIYGNNASEFILKSLGDPCIGYHFLKELGWKPPLPEGGSSELIAQLRRLGIAPKTIPSCSSGSYFTSPALMA